MNTEATSAISGITPIAGSDLTQRVATIRDEVSKAFLGQQEVLDQLLLALLAGGHVLLDPVLSRHENRQQQLQGHNPRLAR